MLCAVSETASNHKDPAVCVNFIKVLADWHFHTSNRGKLCSRWSFIYSFCPLHINQYSFLFWIFSRLAVHFRVEKVRSKLMQKLPGWSGYLDSDSNAMRSAVDFPLPQGKQANLFFYMVITGSEAIPTQKNLLHRLKKKKTTPCLSLFVLQLKVLLVKL